MLRKVTRIDFERDLEAVYSVEDMAQVPWAVTKRHGEDVIEREEKPSGWDLEEALQWLADHQWVVAKWRPAYIIRAWPGDNLPVTRLDFWYRPARRQWRVKKWLAGWHASTAPVSSELKPRGFSIITALDWLNERAPLDNQLDGWNVKRVGSQFVRAWYGPIEPVRNGGQIYRMRDEFKVYRNSLIYQETSPCFVKARPDWLPQDVALTEVDTLDLAYVL